ncbi:MAG: hypothetical protein QM705_00220 [Ancrocorticia sp.]
MDVLILNQVIVAGATLAASFGGYRLAGINERRRDERALEKELRIHVVEREQTHEDEKHSFQRETLLALQDAMQQMARLNGRALHLDYLNAREGKQSQLPSQLDEDTYENLVEVQRLKSRVLDSDLRDGVDSFIGTCSKLTMLPPPIKGSSNIDIERNADLQYAEMLDEIHTEYVILSEKVGMAIRREITWQPKSGINLEGLS